LVSDILDPRGAPGTATVRLGNQQVQVRSGEVIGRDLLYGFDFERFELDLWSGLLRPDDIVVDVGANIGLYAVAAAAHLGEAGRLLVFEPNEDAFLLLEQNVAAVKGGCIPELERRAVGSGVGIATFHCMRDSAYSGLVDTGREPAVRAVEVPVTTLDTEVDARGLARVDLLKIDVEGFEPEVLAGAKRLFAREDAPIVLVEIARENLEARGLRQVEVIEALERTGYEVRVAVPGIPLRSVLDWSSGFVAQYDFIAVKPARRDRLERWLAG
jgi:FkbM family methyltransferase